MRTMSVDSAAAAGVAAESILAFENASFGYRDRMVQKAMSLSFRPGEIVAVLGPNGAGKSTMLKVILGLVRLSSGTVRVFGRQPSRGNRLVGFVPQHRAADVHHSIRGREFVRFGLDGHRYGPALPSKKIEERVDRVLAEVDATEIALRPVGTLSGGERQRLYIAQALITDPRLLLLDEPFNNLDVARVQETVDVVVRVTRNRGITALIVTHDINPLLQVVDRVLYMANGAAAIGAPRDVITSDRLTELYRSPVDVVEMRGKLFVMGGHHLTGGHG